MAKSISSLFSKKGWTGEEVGKVLMSSLIHDIKNLGKKHQPLFTQAEFNKLLNNLNTDRDNLAFGVYKEIYGTITDGFNFGQATFQQFNNGFYRTITTFREIENAENAKQTINKYPIIMTEKQYTRLTNKVIEEKKAFKESYNDLLFWILESIIERDPKNTPKDVIKAIEDTKKETPTNIYYIEKYKTDFSHGYYTAPDGQRSDQMTLEKWQEKLTDLYITNSKIDTSEIDLKSHPEEKEKVIKLLKQKENTDKYKLFFNGAKAIKNAFKEKTGRELIGTDKEILKAFSLNMEGITADTENPVEVEIEKAFTYSDNVTWHNYPETPPDLTKYDLIETYIEENRLDEEKAITDFKKDYPELYNALSSFIEGKIPEAKNLKDKNKDFITWENLNNTGIFNYDILADTLTFDIIEAYNKEYNKKRPFTSIAIIKNPSENQITENGDYKNVESPLIDFLNLDKAINNQECLEDIEGYKKNLIYPALSYLYCFNALLNIFKSIYNIEGLEEISFDISPFESKIDSYNNLLYLFYKDIQGTPEEVEKKRDQIKTIFKPIDVETLKPTKKAINEVTDNITSLGYTTKAKNYLRFLEPIIKQLKGAK